MLNGFMVDEHEYSDYVNDYRHLSGNFFSDLFQGAKSVVGNIWSAVAPAAPAIVYQAATGKQLPPTQVIQQQAPQKPTTPITTYLMYGGAALVAALLVFKVAGGRRRR